MDDATVEATIRDILARLTVHEFMLEVVLANFCRSMPDERADEFIADLRRVGKKAYGPAGDTPEEIAAMQKQVENAGAMLDRLVDKIELRYHDIARR